MSAEGPFAFGFSHTNDHVAPDKEEPRRPGTARPSTRPSTSVGERPRPFGLAVSGDTAALPAASNAPTTEHGDDHSDEDESPFAFAPPAVQARDFTHQPEPFTFVYGLDALEEEDDDCGMFSFHPPRTGEEVPKDPKSDPLRRGEDTPPFLDTYLAPLEGGTDRTHANVQGVAAPAMPPQPSFEGMPSLSPAAAFAHQVQAGLPEWTYDDGFLRHDVLPSTRPKTKRRARQARDDFGPRDGTGDAHPQQRPPRRGAHLPPSLDKDVQLADTGQAIPLNELVSTLPASPIDADKTESAQGPRARSGMRRRPVGIKKPDSDELEDSPYPAVQGSVSNIDDHNAAVLTIRSWVLGFVFCVVFSALNCFFSLRYPAPFITPIVTQLLSYPIGKYLAKVLPSDKLPLPEWMHAYGFPEYLTLNPGPFSIKEHTLLTIMANIATSPAYALSYSLTTEKEYGQPQPAGFDILLVLTSQIIGFGAAGLCRRFLVWPAAMIWPQNLVFSTVLNTLHAELDDEEPGMPRFRFFVYVIVAAFCWFWLPGFLFTALSAFSWLCWIVPNNVVVNQLFGVSSGLGMGLLTFDWSQMVYVVPPLVIPWWAQVNIFVGFVITFWILTPIIYYTNSWYTAFLPISTTSVFDRFGEQYNTSRVLTGDGLHLNETAYYEYSPLFLPAAYSMSYLVQFMLVTGILVHTALYYGPDLWHRLITPHRNQDDDDVHMRLMRNYREVPDLWYAALLVISLGLSMITVGCWNTDMPPWALLIALAFAFVYFLPAGIVFATSGFNFTLNMMIELIAGYLMPGNPKGNMLFKVYAVQVSGLGLYYSQDLKLAHYQKVPPRATFFAQLSSVSVTAFVQVGVKRWLVASVEDLCSRDQAAHLTCPYVRTWFSASTIWGVIGPSRLFSPGQLYNPMLYCMIAGVLLPVFTWILSKRYPRSWFVYINLPVAFVGAMYMPPATGINYSAPLIIGFIFQYLIRHRNFEWWSKYNFLLSAGLDAGTVFSGILIFLTLQLPKGGNISLNWWGNEVYTNTADWAGTPLKTPPPQGFGPTTW